MSETTLPDPRQEPPPRGLPPADPLDENVAGDNEDGGLDDSEGDEEP